MVVSLLTLMLAPVVGPVDGSDSMSITMFSGGKAIVRGLVGLGGGVKGGVGVGGQPWIGCLLRTE